MEILHLLESIRFPAMDEAMLLITQLVSGNGDIYIADGAGFSLLQERGACRAVHELQNGLYLAAVNNEQSVQAALEILIDELGE